MTLIDQWNFARQFTIVPVALLINPQHISWLTRQDALVFSWGSLLIKWLNLRLQLR